jgi:hypothetical protein
MNASIAVVATRTLATGRAPGMKEGPCGLDDIRAFYSGAKLTRARYREAVNKS